MMEFCDLNVGDTFYIDLEHYMTHEYVFTKLDAGFAKDQYFVAYAIRPSSPVILIRKQMTQ